MNAQQLLPLVLKAFGMKKTKELVHEAGSHTTNQQANSPERRLEPAWRDGASAEAPDGATASMCNQPWPCSHSHQVLWNYPAASPVQLWVFQHCQKQSFLMTSCNNALIASAGVWPPKFLPLTFLSSSVCLYICLCFHRCISFSISGFDYFSILLLHGRDISCSISEGNYTSVASKIIYIHILVFWVQYMFSIPSWEAELLAS